MTESAHSPLDELALRTLHGIADEAEREALARLLARSVESRGRFLDHAGLHAMLAREAKAGTLADDTSAFFHRLEDSPARKPGRLLRLWLPAAAAFAAACLLAVAVLPTRASAALDRVIGAISETRDRTYRIEVVEPAPPHEPSRPDRGRFPPANHLDDATLWLRGPREFILSQSLPNGETRRIGSDGNVSWSMRGTGPVRVSPDAERFGRAIFARNGEVAFLDLRTQLEDLKRLYQVERLDRGSGDTWTLVGKRRSNDQGGPREIELWFHSGTGLLERMILRHLPRENGGPRSIAIVLQSTEPLPSDFFSHQSHHEPGRTILPEP